MVEKTDGMDSFQTEVARITSILRKEIYSGKRQPTAHLTESSLAATFSVSRMTIRQVLSHLAMEGLINIEPFKGATVKAVTIDRIVSTYDVVAALEGFAVKLAAAHIQEKDIRKLRKILEKQKQVKEGDTKSWQSLNHDFHKVINLNSRNEEIIKLIDRYTRFTSYWFLTLADTDFDSGIRAHEKVIEALSEQNGEKARIAMEQHILNVVDRLVRHIQKNVPIGMFQTV
ncbi:GntR family transcriptional regulator [bacterium]|nr:GntR family transcriptional regulator [bacterium]